MKLFKNASGHLTDYTKVLFCVPALILIIAIVLNIAGCGIHLGIDFTGGSLVEYALGEEFASADIEKILTDNGFEDFQVTRAEAEDGSMTNVQIRLKDEGETDEDAIAETVKAAAAAFSLTNPVQSKTTAEQIETYELGEDYEDSLYLLFDGDADSDKVTDAINDALEAAKLSCDALRAIELDDTEEKQILVFAAPGQASTWVRDVLDDALLAVYPSCRYVSIEHAGATSSGELIRNALSSLGVALVLMLIYIAIRFDLYSGMAALFGLFHDVMMMLAAMTFCGGAYQINSSFIAALLTIVGYSINDTIIILDRIRENKRLHKEASNNEIVCMSVKASLSRTVNTSITTLFTLAALYLLGVASIKEFTFPLIAGMLAGAYSSNLLNGPLWAILMNRHEARKPAGKGE